MSRFPPSGFSLIPPGTNLPGQVTTYGTLATQTGFQHFFDPISRAQWAYSAGTETFWTYDTPETVGIKMHYVKNRVPDGFGGAFFWAFKDDDANGTLVKTMAKGLGHQH